MYSSEDVNRWLEPNRVGDATHLIIVCDTFSYEDYPVYVRPDQNVGKLRAKYNENMQQVHKVIPIVKGTQKFTYPYVDSNGRPLGENNSDE